MKMDDQTRREREQLNRGLGDIERTTKAAAKESSRSLIDMAKQSKQSVEGIRAVMELGGWLTLASGVVNVLGSITEEARKNSAAFREAGAALDVIGKRAGTSLVKFMEPMISGFTDVLVYGSAVLNHFPEVASIVFDGIGKMMAKAMSWDTIKTVMLAVGQGILAVFSTAFQMIPEIFMSVVQLIANQVAGLGQFIWDAITSPFTGKKVDLAGFLGKQLEQGLKDAGNLAGKYVKTFEKVTAGLAKAGGPVADLFTPILQEMSGKLGAVIMPEVNKTKGEIGADVNKPDAAVQGLLDDWRMKLLQQSGDKLAILDAERAQALVKMQDTLKDADQQGAALKMIDEYYANARQAVLTEANTKAIEEARRAAQELAQAEKERIDQYKAMQEKLKNDNLAGKNGAAAQVGQNFAGTELGALVGGADLITMVISAVVQMAGKIENLGKVLAPIDTIIDGIAETAGPLINDALQPFVNILVLTGRVIVKMLAPSLAILKPIIEAVSYMILFIYNWVLVPVYNLWMIIWNAIYNAFADFVNGILYLVDQIPFVDVGRVQKRNWDQDTLGQLSLSDGATTSSTNSSSSGSSASYAAGTSIRIEKIEIKADFIAGDAGLQQVAIMLRNELLEAERAGR